MLKRLCFSVLAIFTLAVNTLAQDLTEAQRNAIDALVEKVASSAPMPSLVVLIDRGGSTVYERAIGHAELSHKVPATVGTAYGIGSITKTFTGLAINQLVAAGKIDLQKPLSHYLPEYQGPGGRATVAHLLTHSSGIPSYNTEIPEVREALSRNAFTRADLVALFEDLPLNFEPGEKFSYSNSGYYLLGLIIEAVSGLDYYAYLEGAILEPLGMERTYKGDLSRIVPDMARGYAARDGAYVHAPEWHYLVPFSAGSLVSTAADLVRYRRGVFHSTAISPAVRDALLKTTTLQGGQTNRYTLGGLVSSEFGGHPKVSHAGDIWGYASNHAYYPDEDLTIVLLTNNQISSPAPASIEAKLARVVLGLPQPEVRQLSLAADELVRYAGEYRVHPFLIGFDSIGFLVAEGQLHMRFGGLESGAPLIPLLAQGNGAFRASFDDEWVFQFDEDGGVASSIVSSYRDGEIHLHRAN